LIRFAQHWRRPSRSTFAARHGHTSPSATARRAPPSPAAAGRCPRRAPHPILTRTKQERIVRVEAARAVALLIPTQHPLAGSSTLC
jgi:hypothetical protein